MFDTILFDLDGTISDSGVGITRCVAYALSKFGIEVSDLTELNKFVGPPLSESFREFFGFSHTDALKAIEYYRERYSTIGIYETERYEGVCDLISELHDAGKKVALATSKPTVYASKIIEEYGISDCFDVLLGCELDGRRGEKIEVMEECLQMLGVDDERKKKTVMVGDRHYDINGAQHCGIKSIGVTYGYAQGNELEDAGADYIVDSVEGLRCLLLSK